jgi:hypothetical protein
VGENVDFLVENVCEIVDAIRNDVVVGVDVNVVVVVVVPVPI